MILTLKVHVPRQLIRYTQKYDAIYDVSDLVAQVDFQLHVFARLCKCAAEIMFVPQYFSFRIASEFIRCTRMIDDVTI